MRPGSRFGDPEWLFEPDPVLARALATENRRAEKARRWAAKQPPTPVTYDDSEAACRARRRALNADMEGHGQQRKGVA